MVIDVKVAAVYSSLALTDEFCEVDDWTVMDCKFSLDGTYVLHIAYIQLPHEGYIHAFAYNLKHAAHSCKPDRHCFRTIIRVKRCWAPLGYSLEGRMMRLAYRLKVQSFKATVTHHTTGFRIKG